MAVQTVPYALQNASHSAALFRQSASAPYTAGGVLGSLELVVRQQASPNMSVILGPGRAKIPGTAVSPPAGQSWTTQAMYDSLNDADTTLTIATSNPTNPRIDVAYMAINDSFYSGALNSAVAGIVTGTPAASPIAPAVPSNAVALYYIAVGAGVTSIVNANLSRVVTVAKLLGAGGVVADLTALAAVTGASNGDQLYVTALKCMFVYSSGWTQSGIATVASATARDTEYAKASAAYRVNGATVYLQDVKATQVYNGTAWRGIGAQVAIIPTSVVNGTIAPGGAVTFTASTSVTVNGCFTADYDNYLVILDQTAGSVSNSLSFQYSVSGTVTATGYDFNLFYGQNGAAGTTTPLNQTQVNITNVGTLARVELNIDSPFLVRETLLVGNYISTINPATLANMTNAQLGILQRASTSFDGFKITVSSGTATGVIRIYGWNNN